MSVCRRDVPEYRYRGLESQTLIMPSPFSRAAFDEAGRRTSGGLLQEPTLTSFFHFMHAVIVQSRSLNNKLTWFKLLDPLEHPLLFLDLAQNDRQSVLSNGHVEHEYSTSTLLEIARIPVPSIYQHPPLAKITKTVTIQELQVYSRCLPPFRQPP